VNAGSPSPGKFKRSRSRQICEKLFLRSVYHKQIRRNPRTAFILDPGLVENLIPGADLRSWPGNPRLQASGWSKIMFLRYALAMHYGRGKTVLESCCGIGWGAYLLDSVARRLVAVDLDALSLEIAKKVWPSRRTEHVRATVLDLPFADRTFEMVTAVESIEHFSPTDLHRYLSEITRVMKPGGMLVGSSSFPETSAEAEAICAQNPHHLHIATRSEMIDRLDELGFVKIRIFNNRFFFTARKKESRA
jgi:SAM-dependent methyltransferase